MRFKTFLIWMVAVLVPVATIVLLGTPSTAHAMSVQHLAPLAIAGAALSTTYNLLDNAKVVQLLNPATDAAGRTGNWVNGKLARKAFIVCHVTQGNAATVQFSVQQAKTSGGGSAKAISANVRIAANLDCSVNDTLAAASAATSYTTDAALKNKIVVFEVDLITAMDIAGGFGWITVVTGASNAANITQAHVVMVGLRFQESPPPTMVT